MYVLECEMVTPASLEETFAVFEDPYNLARITPPWMGFRIVTQGLEMRVGALIDYELRWLGLPLRWKTEITAYEPPFYFVDEALSSPYRFWKHAHTFRRTDAGTVVGDRVEYDLPLGPLGKTAHAMVVGRQLRGIFSYRQRAIAELLGGGPADARAPSIRYVGT